MATKIILKKSTTGGSAPLAADLDQAELAVNLVDRKIYTKDNGGTIVTLQGAYVDSTEPGNPAEGDLWYDTDNNMLKTHNGSSFVSAGYTTLSQFGVTATAAELNILDGATLTTAELNYVDGVTSSIQTQLNAKLEDITNENLGDLSDVTITSVGDNEFLAYDSTAGAWINQTAAEAGVLTAESDTLATVTGRGATTAEDISLTSTTTSTNSTTGALTVGGGVGIAENLNVGGNAVITGNLTVSGTTTTVNSSEVNIGDSIILLNSDIEGTTDPTEDSGISVKRGTQATVTFFWDESEDYWSFDNQTVADLTLDGGTY